MSDQAPHTSKAAAFEAVSTPPAQGMQPPMAIDSVEEGRPQQAIRAGGWDAELFGCCTDIVPNCCMSWLLPCVSLAQIVHRVGLYSYSSALMFFLVVYVLYVVCAMLAVQTSTYSATTVQKTWYGDSYYTTTKVEVSPSYSVWNYISCVFSVIFFVSVWQIRSKIRARFQIPGSACGDCCATWWCSCCVIAQMATHVKSYKPGSCNFGPVDSLPAYEG